MFDESVETQEVAEPVENVQESAETQEVAEPAPTSEGKTEADAAFAAMRRESQEAQRRAEEAERRLAEMQASINARQSVFENLTGDEDADIAALAEATGRTVDEVRADIAKAEETARKDLQIESLTQQLEDIQVANAMANDLREIQAIDPTVKSIDELGDEFAHYIGAGLSAKEAYFAIQSMKKATESIPPKAIGKVNATAPEKGFFTEAEVNAMSSEEKKKNYKAILASLQMWK